MATHDLDVIPVVDIRDDNNSRPLGDSSFPTSGPHTCHAISLSDTHDCLPRPTPVLTNYRTHPSVLGSPASHTSDVSSHCAHSSTRSPSTGDNNPWYVYFPSPSPSGDTNMISDTTRIDSLLARQYAGLRPSRDGAELARPVETCSNDDPGPFLFNPHQLVALDAKSLENLERLGGVDALVQGLGTNSLCGLNAIQRLRQSGSLVPDQGSWGAATPSGVELTPVPLTSPTEPSTASFGGVDRSASLDEATIEDRQRIYGRNTFPQRPSKRLLLLMWLALHNKVLVRPKVSHTFL